MRVLPTFYDGRSCDDDYIVKETFQLLQTKKYTEKAYHKVVQKTDIQPFFGIMYMRRSYGLNNHEISTFNF